MTASATPRAPIAVALDRPDLLAARQLAEQVAPHVSTLKLGLELMYVDGPSAATAVADGLDVDLFFDLKLHDIPNTVAGAVRSVRKHKPRWVTVHASGGRAMVAAAVEEAEGIGIVGVTVLTSLDEADLDQVGLTGPASDAAVRLAVLAVEAGAAAIVCSPLEAARMRAELPAETTLIVPGVRPAGSDAGDQARVATPSQALAAGADLLVIGRPINAAADPAAAAAGIAASL